ncbi:hypothetical protein NSTCB13_00007 [Nostoc sp. DSM 114160]|jgi:hypothetical protein
MYIFPMLNLGVERGLRRAVTLDNSLMLLSPLGEDSLMRRIF